jgi:hypothetical protein
MGINGHYSASTISQKEGYKFTPLMNSAVTVGSI